MPSNLPFISLDQLVGTTQLRIHTGRPLLLAAFDRVVELTGRRQLTDLHVRRLLKYIRAQDKRYIGIERTVKQLANKLVLSISTCRRVIRRAVEHFGLLIVTEQRHCVGGQTHNLYTINWDHVDALLNDEAREYAVLKQAKQVASDLALLAEANRPSPESTVPGSTDVPVGSSDRAPVNEVSDSPVRPAPGSDPGAASTCMHTSLPNARCASCHEQALASGVKLKLGWMMIDGHPDGPIYYDQPPPPHLYDVFNRLAHTPRPSPSDLTPRGQNPPFPIKLPKGTPPELLAHFETVLAKVQAAIDCAKLLSPKRPRPSHRKGRRAKRLEPSALEKLVERLQWRLTRLLWKIEFTHLMASTPAMCRNYLPPWKTRKQPTLNATPIDFSAMANRTPPPLEPSNLDFFQFDLSNINFTEVDLAKIDFSGVELSKIDFSQPDFDPAKIFDELPECSAVPTDNDDAPVPSDHPVATTDQPPSSAEYPDSLTSKVESLLVALDELRIAIKAALRCARAVRITWLKETCISWLGKTKTIRAHTKIIRTRANTLTAHSPSGSSDLSSQSSTICPSG